MHYDMNSQLQLTFVYDTAILWQNGISSPEGEAGLQGTICILFSKAKLQGARCSSVVRAFAHGAMGRQIDPSWGGPIELFLVPASAPRLV